MADLTRSFNGPGTNRYKQVGRKRRNHWSRWVRNQCPFALVPEATLAARMRRWRAQIHPPDYSITPTIWPTGANDLQLVTASVAAPVSSRYTVLGSVTYCRSRCSSASMSPSSLQHQRDVKAREAGSAPRCIARHAACSSSQRPVEMPWPERRALPPKYLSDISAILPLWYVRQPSRSIREFR